MKILLGFCFLLIGVLGYRQEVLDSKQQKLNDAMVQYVLKDSENAMVASKFAGLVNQRLRTTQETIEIHQKILEVLLDPGTLTRDSLPGTLTRNLNQDSLPGTLIRNLNQEP